jgi:hypothetical protein
MMTCTTLRAILRDNADDANVLEHLRACDACLDYAATVDPDLMFRALGGGELVPPGGVDAFTADVMREVRLRETEQTVELRRGAPWWQRGAIAAAITLGLTGALAGYRFQHQPVSAPAGIAATHLASIPQANLTTRPVVEKYDSKGATILEVPAEGANDVAMVMIFDEQLPSDL